MYYAMMRSDKPGRWIDTWPFIKGLKWKQGATITVAVPDPFPVTLKPYNENSPDHGADLPSYLEGTGPLFRDDLIEAMRSFGVDNLQTFNVALQDPDHGPTNTN